MIYNIVGINSLTNQQTSKDAGMVYGEFSKSLVKIMDDIIFGSAVFDKDELCYRLEYQDLDQLDKERLLAQLISDQPDYGNESTGADNDSYQNKMLPALVKLLQNSTDRESRVDFIESWTAGVSSYAANTISYLLERRMEEYNYGCAQDAREEQCCEH